MRITALYNTRRHTATHVWMWKCSTTCGTCSRPQFLMQHTAVRCNHCITLQHTAIRCNTCRNTCGTCSLPPSPEEAVTWPRSICMGASWKSLSLGLLRSRHLDLVIIFNGRRWLPRTLLPHSSSTLIALCGVCVFVSAIHLVLDCAMRCVRVCKWGVEL